MSDEKAIAIVPARAGSKRIPNKNVIDFFGKPLMAWTIEAALRADCFERVLVSTDSEDTARLARIHGAAAPFYRTVGCDDHSPVSLATISAARQAEDFWGERYEIVVQLLPCCPLRTTDDILDALDSFRRATTHFQISAYKYDWMNPWWAVRLSGELRPTPLFPEAYGSRSQDLEPLYGPTGAIWIARRDALFESGTFYGPDHTYHPLDWKAAIDIDVWSDLDMCRALYLLRERDSELLRDSEDVDSGA